MLNELRKHFLTTNIQEIKKNWQEIEAMGFEDGNAFELVEFWEERYKFFLPEKCTLKSVEIPENMAPNFPGSFFSLKIAA